MHMQVRDYTDTLHIYGEQDTKESAKVQLKIAVAGIGYVGLSSATLLAKYHRVYAVDINSKKVDMLNGHKSPIQDKDIQKYLEKGRLNLTATQNESLAYMDADFVIVAVPTNYDSNKNYFDTSAVETVIRQVIKINPKAMIVIKSTVPVGYTESVRQKLGYERILFCPEFLREDRALYDNLHPSRIIVGTDRGNPEMVEKALLFANILKESAVKSDVPVLLMNSTEAEAVKLFSNTYLALRVSYFNELDTYAELKGLNAEHIIQGVCLDPRIGTHYNNPSFGYGGYCLPKDTKQMLANYSGIPQRLIQAVVEANQVRKQHIAGQILQRVKELDRPVVGIYRLAMKSGSDNFRESAVLSIMELLQSEGIGLLIYDPALKTEKLFGKYPVENDFATFSSVSSLIIANRCDALLDSVKDKVYTRDVFGQN